MYSLADKSQFQAGAVLQGRHKLATIHQELLNWITEQFGIRALDFYFETRRSSKDLSQQLVHLILETVDDVKKIQSNRDINHLIQERFLSYFKSANSTYHTADTLKNDICSFQTDPLPEIIITYRPLKVVDSKIVNEMLDDEKRAILKTYESVWTLSQSVVFYYTDAQVKENALNGLSVKINEELEGASKRYGFEAGSSYNFDSKEAFERDYDGNWYYYWK